MAPLGNNQLFHSSFHASNLEDNTTLEGEEHVKALHQPSYVGIFRSW